MRLSTLRRTTQEQQNSGVAGLAQSEGTVTEIAAFERPGIVAMLKGESEPVRITATGDAKGHSPVFQFLDKNGKVDWASQEDFQIIDTQFLPPSSEAITQALRAVQRNLS